MSRLNGNGHYTGHDMLHQAATPAANGNGRVEVTRLTIPILLVVALIIAAVTAAFQAGDLWRAHQHRMTSIEGELRDVRTELVGIKDALKDIAANRPVQAAKTWSAATEVRRN